MLSVLSPKHSLRLGIVLINRGHSGCWLTETQNNHNYSIFLKILLNKNKLFYTFTFISA